MRRNTDFHTPCTTSVNLSVLGEVLDVQTHPQHGR